jgi:hypothetical protein
VPFPEHCTSQIVTWKQSSAPCGKLTAMSDRDARLISILRIARDASPRGAGVSIREALKRVSYGGYRTTFKASDLRPLIAADPTLVEDWLAYSEDKRTSGGLVHPEERCDWPGFKAGFANHLLEH